MILLLTKLMLMISLNPHHTYNNPCNTKVPGISRHCQGPVVWWYWLDIYVMYMGFEISSFSIIMLCPSLAMSCYPHMQQVQSKIRFNQVLTKATIQRYHEPLTKFISISKQIEHIVNLNKKSNFVMINGHQNDILTCTLLRSALDQGPTSFFIRWSCYLDFISFNTFQFCCYSTNWLVVYQ